MERVYAHGSGISYISAASGGIDRAFDGVAARGWSQQGLAVGPCGAARRDPLPAGDGSQQLPVLSPGYAALLRSSTENCALLPDRRLILHLLSGMEEQGCGSYRCARGVLDSDEVRAGAGVWNAGARRAAARS